MTRTLSLIMLLSVLLACNKIDQPKRIQPGESLPVFSIRTNTGENIDNNSFNNEEGLIVFFHTGCPDCVKELSSLQPFYEKYSSIIKIILISRAQPASEIEKYWKEKGYTMPYSAQEDRSVYELFSNTGIPFAVFTVNGKVKNTWDDKVMFSEEEYLKLKNNK